MYVCMYVCMYVVPIIIFDAEVNNLSEYQEAWMDGLLTILYISQYISKHTYLPYCAD